MPEMPRPLAELLATIIESREAESARVSRFLHDEIGQVLSAAGLQLDVLRLDLKDRVPEIVERTAEIQAILERAVKQVRELSYELNPAIVERAGLPFALDRLAGRIRNEFPGTVRLLVDPALNLPKQAANAFYKIAEHAVENAAVHAHSPMIEILVRHTRRGPEMEVRDHGAGFDVQATRAKSPGLGLVLMEHYARVAGLEYSIESTPGEGTIVKAGCPLERKRSRTRGDETGKTRGARPQGAD
jgi:signal transduction histidine kinase